MLPCLKEGKNKELKHDLFEDRADNFRRLLSDERRILSGDNIGSGCKEIRGWKQWEQEIITDNEMMNGRRLDMLTITDSLSIFASEIIYLCFRCKFVSDPRSFRLTNQTSFVKNHTSYWMRNPFSFYVICFFRQFFQSVRKADYLTMRHGFITVHLAPGSRFNFQKYIKRSLEDDFKIVVGISPILWASVVLFLLLNVHGWAIMYVITLTPLILQGIISQMAIEITERHTVIQGIPLVQVSDNYFWFRWPELVLHLIHFVLFQNAFEITYFLWIWYEYGLRSCFHDDFVLTITRVILGVGVQFLCSYITLPLYALVTQMGSTMKRSIFDDQTSKALRQWHKKAMLRKSQKSQEVVTTPDQTANVVASVDNEDQRNAAPSGQQQLDLLSS
ncbi:hypothetical protein LWI28_016048 [Acer negundo]|uniref:MLO-like protein n=1 Tax=Acer negundo TaxID=4023 RepID=A0AAD5JTZ1_ACENE|nr:hypothetical protein LWI28_016048 [Acer negundo]